MNSLLGLWLFTSIIYKGDPLPRPNPHLIMTLNFVSAHQNVLKYSRENESGFCERTAQYSFDGKQLIQKVIATHPDNASYCSTDSDMKMGTESITELTVSNGTMLMPLSLGDETLTYVWTRTEGILDEE